MTDYIVTREVVTSRANQADAPDSPALSLAREVNRRDFTKAGETEKDYTSSTAPKTPTASLTRSKQEVCCGERSTESGECDLLISRSHCNIECYLHVCIGGDAA